MSDDLPDYSGLQKGAMALLVGDVQGGKTKEIIRFVDLSVNTGGCHAIVLVRNIQDDLGQIESRMLDYNRKNGFRLPPRIKMTDTDDQLLDALSQTSRPCVMLGLANARTLRRLATLFDRNPKLERVGLVIDEGDQVIPTLQDRTQAEEYLSTFCHRLNYTYQVTATPFSVLLTNRLNYIFDLPRDPDYHDLSRITHIPVSSVKSGRYYDPKSDQANLNRFIQDILSCRRGIGLINGNKLKDDHRQTIEVLRKHYPSITYVEYNGNRIQVMRKGDVEPQVFTTTKNTHSISSVLEELKQEYDKSGKKSNSHIIIVSGHKAGRGISFVSKEYDWHLTHQYLVSSATAHLETCLQEVRILGVYRDRPKLSLYCEETVWAELVKFNTDLQHLIQMARNKQIGDCIELIHSYTRQFTAARKRRPWSSRTIEKRYWEIYDNDPLLLKHVKEVGEQHRLYYPNPRTLRAIKQVHETGVGDQTTAKSVYVINKLYAPGEKGITPEEYQFQMEVLADKVGKYLRRKREGKRVTRLTK